MLQLTVFTLSITFQSLLVREWQAHECGYHGDDNEPLAAALPVLWFSFHFLYILYIKMYAVFVA